MTRSLIFLHAHHGLNLEEGRQYEEKVHHNNIRLYSIYAYKKSSSK